MMTHVLTWTTDQDAWIVATLQISITWREFHTCSNSSECQKCREFDPAK